MLANVKADLINHLFESSPAFQRSINIKYDLMAEEYIKFYVPTPKSVEALTEVANACLNQHYQRSHIFTGPYGVGKSIFAVTLAGLLAREPKLEVALKSFVGKVIYSFPELGAPVLKLFQHNKRFLPVILSGDEGPLEDALTNALVRSLQQFNLTAIKLPTMYKAVQDKVIQWKEHYPDVYKRFCDCLQEEHHSSVDQFLDRVVQFDVSAYDLFCKLHSTLAAGAPFNYFNNQSPIVWFEQVAEAIKPYGFTGIVIVYDEFGRFLEGRMGKPKGLDAQLLQDLAEFCNRTTDPIVHFIAITHKVMTQYSQGLNDEVRIEWQRIEGRFKTLSLAGDTRINYGLLAQSLHNINKHYMNNASPNLQAVYRDITKAIEMNIFDLSTDEAIEMLEKCIPIHPFTTFCLPEISNKIAQNERTLYTFLFGRDEYSLSNVLENYRDGEYPLVYVDVLYDYFNEAMKLDNGPGGVHDLWCFAEGVLGRISRKYLLARRMVKALAIIHAVKKSINHRPNDELLAFSLGVEVNSNEYQESIRQIVESKMVFYRISTDCWEFVQRSDINIEAEIRSTIEAVQPSKDVLINLLQRELRTQYYPARKYIDKYGTTRYFTGCYYTLEQLRTVSWDEELIKQNYCDGFVIYVLVTNQVEAEEVKSLVVEKQHEQIIFVLPETYMNIYDTLTELFGLSNLISNKINLLIEQDPKSEQEIKFLYEDCLERIKKRLTQLTDPGSDGVWYYQGQLINVRNFSAVCHYISEICERVFSKTPIIYNEALNRREPSSQQVKAMKKLIDSLFQDHLSPGLGLTGSGPEVAIYKTVLKAHGLVKEYETYTELVKPVEENLRAIWDEIESFIFNCSGNGLFVDVIVKKLQLPPYGIRKGILPIFIAVVIARYINKISLEYQGRAISPITSTHIAELVRHAEKYSIKFFILEDYQKNILEALLIAIDAREEELIRLKQPINRVSQQLNNWLVGLSSFAKTTNEYISTNTIQFRETIKESKQDPFKALLTKMPTIIRPPEDNLESYLVVVKEYINELQKSNNKLLEYLLSECRKIFGDEQLEVNSLAYSWWNNLINGHSVDKDNYQAGDIYSNVLIKFCNMNVTEHDWVSSLAKEYTGLSLEFWNDDTVEKFITMLRSAKERVARELKDSITLPSEQLVTVSFGTEDNTESFSYRKIDLTPSGIKLLNILKRTIDTTGKHLNQDQRMELCMEMLKYLIK